MRDGASKAIALKVLNARKQDSERYQRFVQEVEALRSLGDIDGVLPVIEAYLPTPGAKEQLDSCKRGRSAILIHVFSPRPELGELFRKAGLRGSSVSDSVASGDFTACSAADSAIG